VDVIAAEDTRRTGLLLHLLGIETRAVIEKKGGSGSGPQLISHHEHNFKKKIPDILELVLVHGKSVAVVSDAGTPGISDPGTTAL
jgi:16S rRNA (cytidine1402-2'-O)-methyltransferase